MTWQEPDAEIVIESPETCLAAFSCTRQVSFEQIEQAVASTASEINVRTLTISAHDDSDPETHRVTLWSGTSVLDRESWCDIAEYLRHQLGIRSIALTGGSLCEVLS